MYTCNCYSMDVVCCMWSTHMVIVKWLFIYFLILSYFIDVFTVIWLILYIIPITQLVPENLIITYQYWLVWRSTFCRASVDLSQNMNIGWFSSTKNRLLWTGTSWYSTYIYNHLKSDLSLHAYSSVCYPTHHGPVNKLFDCIKIVKICKCDTYIAFIFYYIDFSVFFAQCFLCIFLLVYT